MHTSKKLEAIWTRRLGFIASEEVACLGGGGWQGLKGMTYVVAEVGLNICSNEIWQSTRELGILKIHSVHNLKTETTFPSYFKSPLSVPTIKQISDSSSVSPCSEFGAQLEWLKGFMILTLELDQDFKFSNKVQILKPGLPKPF